MSTEASISGKPATSDVFLPAELWDVAKKKSDIISERWNS